MESYLIWIGTLSLLLVIVLPYFLKHRKTQREDSIRRQEAIRLGADKAVAQHPQIDPFTCIGCGACVEACPEGNVLGIVSGKAVIVNGLKCVGHGKCAEACPVEGIIVGLGDAKDRDDIPSLSENLETNIPGLFIAGELGGLALIKNAIHQGNQVVEYIANKNNPSSSEQIFDLLIIGAGPAGYSAALSAEQYGLKYLLVDQQEAGGTILQYPRKKLVMTKPVQLPLYGTLSKPEYSKEELLEIWQDTQERFKVKISTGDKLNQIEKVENIFQVQTENNAYQSLNVILALGRRGTPRKLNVPGEHLSKVMYKLIDAETYQQEHLLVVGGGDSAIEAAMGLARQPGNTVTLSYRKEKFFRIKTRNEQRLAEFISDGKIKVLFNSGVETIKKESVSIRCQEGIKEIPNHYTFIFAGGEPPFKLLKEIGVQFGLST